MNSGQSRYRSRGIAGEQGYGLSPRTSFNSDAQASMANEQKIA